MNYSIGDRVVVVRGGTYDNVPKGSTGTVRSYYNGNLAIIIDGIDNPRSSYNCFYFTTRCIKHIEEKESNIMEGNYTIAQIRFLDESNPERAYKYACYDPDIAIGDICVVASAHHGLGIARVVGMSTKTDEKITREIVCKCDFSAYNNRQLVRQRREALLKKMQARADELREIALFKALAANDEDMSTMLNEYNTLEGAL